MLKNLKSLFVTTEEEQVTAAAKTTQVPEIKSSGSQPAASAAPKQVDNAILDRLLQAIENNNQAGFDYLEYRNSLKSLAALPMDEPVKFQSAFATAATMGVTLYKLLASIEFYKKVLRNEEDTFLKASKEQYLANVENKTKEKEKINAIIKDKSLKIQKLTEEIRAHQAEMEEMAKQIEAGDAKIKETSASFEHAMQLLISQMDQDGLKLKQYIK
jgi:hypothetical protein